MPPLKFQLRTKDLGGDFVWRIPMAAVLDIGTERLSESPTKFQLNPTYGSEGDVEQWKANDGRTTDGRTDDGQQIIA